MDIVEVSIGGLQDALASGATSSEKLTAAYLDRIDALGESGPKLNAVRESTPDALSIAAALDAERRAGN